MTIRVRDVMTTEVVTVTPDTHFKTIASLLESHRVNQLPVVDAEHHVLGVVSEADLLAKVESEGRERPGRVERWLFEDDLGKSEGTLASEIMTRAVETIGPDATVIRAAKQMSLIQVKSLPVVNQGERLVGIVSRTDLLKRFVRDDASIHQEVVDDVLRDALAIKPAAVAAVVKDGLVVLLGEVETRGLRNIITNMVGAIPGVVSVENRVGYRGDASSAEATREPANEVSTPALR